MSAGTVALRPTDYAARRWAVRLCDVPQWYEVAAECGKCKHRGWVDRWDLQRSRGREAYFIKMEPCLLCLVCGNKEGNYFGLVKVKR